ncbi:MAG: NAD(P)(+) transhydrogenase (Re/Si-specific) subunit beta [Opitutales bacterium]
MSASILIDLAYIASAILFIFGIKMLGSATTARKGNRISAIGMLLAVVVTLLDRQIVDYQWIIGGLVIGAAIGAIAAKKVEMTGMPELVALFNGFGGAASLLVAWAEFARSRVVEGLDLTHFTGLVVALAVLIGGVTFTGSLIAWGKLAGKLSGSPKTFEGQKQLNIGLMAGGVVLTVLLAFLPTGWPAVSIMTLLIALALTFGVLAVIPIGGGDMPVVIALLNSLSGLAASAAGFVIGNKVLIVAGCLVGASGLILTVIMCKAMNRTLVNVLIGGFGGSGEAVTAESDEGGELKPISADDAYYILEAASKVMFIPGYGMAVAQAQHVVKELAGLLEENGCEVGFAIHPVAGRMPGHMNVLLAEADVEYEQLLEMDDANPQMPMTDVAIVIGANDVVNPAAARDQSSPIYGMPIIEAHQARTVFVLKRGQGTGFSGLQNRLFLLDNTRMLYGDAKTSISHLVSQFKEG